MAVERSPAIEEKPIKPQSTQEQVLYRAVPQGMVQAEVVGSNAFIPSKNNKNRLSAGHPEGVNGKGVGTPAEFAQMYDEKFGKNTVAVVATPQKAYEDEGCIVTVDDDGFDGHTTIVFPEARSRQKKIGKKLKTQSTIVWSKESL